MKTTFPTSTAMRAGNAVTSRSMRAVAKQQPMMPLRSRPSLVIKAASHPHGAMPGSSTKPKSTLTRTVIKGPPEIY